MNKKHTCIGDVKIKINNSLVEGVFLKINNEIFYKISNYDKMPPFLVSIVSATDHWLYISSNGGITAGRKNSDNALFQYSNDDVLHYVNEFTGNKTILKIVDKTKIYLWEPFSDNYKDIYSVSRNLYKNISSTEIIFEEINHDLKLIFQYSWTCSEKYGLIKSSQIFNKSGNKKEIEVLDGIQNILPSGVSQQLQTEYSTLIDGYKKNELISPYGIGVFSLSSIPSDMAHPSESLVATTVWVTGITVQKYLLSSTQIVNFRKNLPISQEENIYGIKGAYLINSRLKIKSQSSVKWLMAAEINQDAGNLIELLKIIKQKNSDELLLHDIKKCKQKLTTIIAQTDGLQLTGNKLNSARHFSNVLFNVMRGGIFVDSYNVKKDDFISFVKNANLFVFNAHKSFFDNIDDILTISELKNKVISIRDPHFTKLAFEYLPLTFSRRHGDPSRPWNKFSIDIKDKNNNEVLNYEGNWRDIFQNWEALALSYPGFLESMISKFLNTSTADGYNPYRINRNGFDWEVQEPHNPWANIGYWGDHQVIYLLKLLELSKEYNSSALNILLDNEIFSFANVPYRIKDYKEILNDPHNTIEFDYKLDEQLKRSEMQYGSDSKLLKKNDNSLVQVNLLEKLLLILLVKLSNFVFGGGIWMNTQRPEWNDAKNALVGQGVSMVTLYYTRRYVNYLKNLLSENSKKEFNISKEVAKYYNNIQNIIDKLDKNKEKVLNDKERKNIVDLLGFAGSDYRRKIYENGFAGEKQLVASKLIIEFCESVLSIIDCTIKDNKREDGLYHSYNILHFLQDELKITNLYEMLEGQVAVLSSGYLSVSESINLLKALKKSQLYRIDQNSYMLYPNKKLSKFIDKNNISADLVNKSKLLLALLSYGNKEIIYKDEKGGLHFQSDIINSNQLKKKLESLSDERFKKYADNEFSIVLDIYEKTFLHKEFTGRATTFYKYEGLGSIYWHMVSKLLLAVQEVYFEAVKKTATKKELNKLKEIYYDIKSGIGVGKKPDQYGAFPTDPYSHTPSFAGVQQPGMTGQVKEDIISRFRELGIIIEGGKILINPSLLKKEEFLKKGELFIYPDLNGQQQNINCRKKSLVITYCQVPFVFTLSDTEKIVLHKKNGEEIKIENLIIDEESSKIIFNRNNIINYIEVHINGENL